MSDVPRETPPRPAAAEGVFPVDRLDLASAYAELLATEGVVRGLIGPREVPRLWDRHLLNCAVVAEAVPQDATVCDVGSGAGLPGLVLAVARPDLQITLVEPLLRRTVFLQEVVEALGLSQVTVHRGRADALHGAARFDVVTSRAVAPLGRLLDWSMPLVSPTGALVAMKGTSAASEVEEHRATWVRLGCAEPEVLEVGGPDPAPAATLVRVVWADPARVSSGSADRRSAAPGSRPARRTGRASRTTRPRGAQDTRKRT